MKALSGVLRVIVLGSAVQKPEKLSSVCVAGALHDGLCAYTALHTHARVASGHTLLVTDGGSVCLLKIIIKKGNKLERDSDVDVWNTGNDLSSSHREAFRPHVHPVGLLSWSEGSDDVTLAAGTRFLGAASAARWCVQTQFSCLCAKCP